MLPMDLQNETRMETCEVLAPPSLLPSLPLSGHWFRPGAKNAILTICENGTVGMQTGMVLNTSGPVMFNKGEAHGIGTFYVHPDMPCSLNLAFHWNAEVSFIEAHHLTEKYPGVFVTAGYKTMFVVPARFSLCPIPSKLFMSPEVMPAQVLRLFEQYGNATKHCMLWLHPKRDQEWLLLLKSQQVFWCNGDGTAHTPGPTGQYQYFNPEGLLDFWYIKFHCAGVQEREETNILVRVRQPEVPDAHIWRLVDVHTLDAVYKQTLQNAEGSPVGNLVHNHIVMLEVGV